MIEHLKSEGVIRFHFLNGGICDKSCNVLISESNSELEKRLTSKKLAVIKQVILCIFR